MKKRNRTYRDLRYVPTTDLNHNYASSHLSEAFPRYRSQYGLHTETVREPYYPYQSLNNLYSDGSSMSRHTRNYDVSNRNYDVNTKTYDSPRLYERRSPETERPPILDLGTDFRRRNASDRTHESSTRSYGRDPGGDSKSRSPTRTTSLTDHDRHKPDYGESTQHPHHRQRNHSGDSLSSQSSERSDKGDNSKALFKAYQNRYKEHAEKHAEESSTKTPFSTWRRSGNFEDESSNMGTKSLDSEKPRVERQSRIFRKTEDHERSDVSKKESKHEASKKLESPRISKDLPSPKEQEADKGDELMFNFRQALRRHQVSGEKRTSEERDSSKDVHKSTAEMIEKIRAAKAQIKHLKEAQLQSEDSDVFISKSGGKERRKALSSSSVEETDVSISKSGGKERRKVLSSSSVEETDEKHISKSIPKLARQKLVSDDLKAKYIESKKEEKENEDKVRSSETENVPKKRTHRKQKQKEHIDFWAKPEGETSKVQETEQTKVVQTDRDLYRKALAEKFKKDSSGFEFGTSFASKPKTVESKDEVVEKIAHQKDVEKSSPSYDSVFHDGSDSKLTEQSDQINLADKPVYSLVYQEPSSKSLAPYGVTYASKSTVDNVPSHQNLKDTQSVETEKVKGKIERKTPRQLKKHTKAKTLELGVLSQPVEEKPSLQTSQDDTAVGSNTTTDDLLRKERIEKYKEERKKQLATVFGGGDSELPSLFLSSRTEADATPISRSKSLKVESGSKSDSSQSSVGRSKSMKEESQAQTSKISGLQLAELGSQAKDSYDSHQQRSKTSSQSKDLTDKDSKEITHRTMLAEMVLAEDREHAVKSSFEKETDSGHESTDSSKRIRRQLPSLQDVLGTTVIEKEKTESKQIETYYINDDRRKPIGKMKDTDIKRKPAEFSLDYSKVKVIPKTGPAENSKEQVMPESSKNIGVVIPQRSHNLTESKSDNQVKSEIEGRPVKHVFDHTEKRVVDLEKTSDIESDIPKDSVSKMSKHFMHSKDKGKSDTVMFGSDYRKPKTETDFIGKSIHEVRPVPLIQNLNTQIEPTPMELAVINTISKVPAGDEISKNKDIDKHSDRSSLTPERVISVSEAHKVFSESSHKQDFATEYHQKRKESPAFEKIKASPTAVKDTISSVTKSQNELVGQQSSKNNSLSADLNRSESQRIRKPHHTDSGSETGDYTGMKPPMSPRSEKKRSESKFGKVSYRSTASEDVKTDSQKERERSKSRELSREKEIKRPQDTIKERSPSLESIPKSDIKIRNLKERSPSADTISKAGVTKISYRDLEKSKPDVQRKFDIESKERPASVVFGSDFRKVSKIDSDKKETPGSMLLGSDYRKPKSDADIKDRSAPGMVVGSDYRKPNSDADIKDRSAPGAVVGSDYRKPKYDTGTKDKSESTVFGSDFRKTKIETQHVGKSVPEDRAPSDAVKIVKAEVKETQPPATAVVQPSQAKVDRVAPVVQPSQAKVDRVAPVVQPSQAKVDRVAPVVQPSQAKVDRVAPVVQPSQAKVDRVAPVVKPATISMKTASTIIEKPTYKEEKMGVSEKDTKFSIKDDAVSTASGHVIEVPVSPRQKSPPKIVASVTSKHSVPKSDLNTEVKPTARELQPTESKENVKKTSTQISLERQASEPSETKLVETKSSDVKVKPSSSDKATDQVTMKNKTSEKERSKPVQYVHPTAPLLSFSAKTEAPKTMEVPPTKTIQLPEKKTEIKTEIKSEKQDKGGESNQDYISRRAKEEAWKKPVDTTSEFHKKTVEKMLLDTSLDDILSRNVDYLSDENKESSGSARGRAIKKSRPQSVHEESRSHGRTKRIFKKKNLQRSKSEDRSHFMVEGSGAVRRRSQGTEDISRSREKAKGTDSRSRDNRQDRANLCLKGRRESSTDSTSSERISRFDGKLKLQSEGSAEKILFKSSVQEDKHRETPNDSEADKDKDKIRVIPTVSLDRDKDKIRVTPTDSKTGTSVSGETVILKSENVDNQSVEPSYPPNDGMLYREHDSMEKDVSDSLSDLLAGNSSMELLSDTSDFSDRKRFEIISVEKTGDYETMKRMATPESESSVSSSNLSEGSRKRRKDKSSLRKSKLNESTDDSITRRRDAGVTDLSRANRIGVRRVSSSRLARESRDDKYKEEADRRVHEASKLITKHETSLNTRNGNVNQSNNLSSARNKSLNNLDQLTSQSRVIHSTVLDSQTVLPSRFALPSKVSSAITKLSEATERVNKEGSSSGKDDKTSSPRGFRRGNNFSALLQKFSSSEASSSEKSDTDAKSSNLRKPFLTRQEAYTVSSSQSSEETRRTPERTQSLRLRGSQSSSVEKEGLSVQRSSSFKSDFMKRRRYSPEPEPEPEQRRRLPETPVAQKQTMEQSDKPSPELADVLTKRSQIVKNQQETGDVQERERIHDGRVEKADKFVSADVDEVIVDNEVARMLKSRRKETDSSVEVTSDKDTRSQQKNSGSEQTPKIDVVNAESKTLTKLQDRSRSQTPEKSLTKTEIPKLKSQSSFESKTSIHVSSTKPKTEDHLVSLQEKNKKNISETVPKLDLTSIDTSLAVLEHVTHELDEPKVDLKDEKEIKLHKGLHDVHVDKQTEVVQFLHSVEGDNLNANHSVIQPKVPDEKLNVDIVKIEKERTEKDLDSALRFKGDKTVDTKLSYRGHRQGSQEKEIKEKHDRELRSESPTTAGTVDITNKNEIKKKFTRDRTPERQSPKRNGPMKVMSQLKVSAGAGLTRTESVGRSESERPKGILKRTPSLHKTGVNVDPELASILKNRRAKHEDVEEEEVGEKLTAREEIMKHRESQQSPEDGSEGRNISVAERIFQMHNKIEEVRSCPITPKARSGLTTPKSALYKSGTISPKTQFSFDEPGKATPVSSSQLIERLTSLEGKQEVVKDRRKKFQAARKQEGWRTRTQPVTLLEVQEADSLETVRKFRSEILNKASTDVFENLQKEDKFLGQKTEYPQHFIKEKRPRDQRHKTLPVTAAELNAVPEDQIAESMNSLKKKFEAFGARDSKADSGILSGSENDFLERDSSLDEHISEDDPIKLSVSAKASMFHQLEEKSKERADKKSASGAKRYIDRKKRERSRTQPITEEEVHTAAVKADEENKEDQEKTTEENVPSEKDEVPDEGQGDADELSRQSLADKVKLFKNIEEAEKKPPKKAPAPPPKRRNRKLASRFATQPVTYEEVEKAAKISPLAMSLVKPPDPEILSGLSVKAQRELMSQHAQKFLSQPGSRSGSQPVSRTTSVGDLRPEADVKGGKSGSDTAVNIDIKGTPKVISKTDADVRGILKVESDKSDSLSDKKSILKPHELPGETDQEVRSILKLGEKSGAKSESDSSRSTLKQELEQKLTLHLQQKDSPKIKGLLKMESYSESVQSVEEVKSVLKSDSSFDSNKPPEPKGILKKEGSFEQRTLGSTDVDKYVPQKPKEEPITEQGAVSDDSLDNLDSDDGILSHSPTPESDKNLESNGAPTRRSSRTKRRFNRDRTQEAERYRTQPAESTNDKDGSESPGRRKKSYTGRHLTQPITPGEKREAEVATEMPEIQKSSSITDRLNALKKSGEEEWRKRVSKPIDLDALTPPPGKVAVTPPVVKMREKKHQDTPRPSSIADRLFALDTAQEGWRDRVGETDVKTFTIEHKLTKSGQGLGESPLVARLKQKPKRDLSRDSDTSETSDLPSPVTPTKESSKIPLPKEVICTDIPIELEESQGKPSSLATIKSVEEEENKGPVSVEVPKIDEEIEEFFQTNRESMLLETGLNFEVDDFNELFLNANDILSSTRKIRPKRRHNASSRNPLKTMSACLEVRSEYTEIMTGVADKELKRIQTAKIAQGSGFAVEALAGLASKENFSKIELRKTEANGVASKSGNTRHDPYLPLMLIHIKGRRKVQCRLVQPTASSLNSGDSFVVVTAEKIVQWIGDYSNVIEKAKAADVADFIKQKRDLGCKRALAVSTVEEKKGLMGAGRQFFSLIGGLSDYMNCGPQEEDELYENHIVETNMIYKLEKNKLVPVEEYWGNQPKVEMLKPDQVFVFDFGSELYIWQGKSVTPAQRKIGLKLAEQLWEKGYDYSSCDVNPLCPLKTEEEGGMAMKSDSRPEWALFGKVNQNMETILFREKFADWPDTSRLIKVKSQEEVSTNKFDQADLKPYDAKLMVPVNESPVSLKLEGSHVGRGNKWEEDMEGFMKVQNVETLKIVVWHVLEYDHFQVEDHSYGQFHEGDTYVIRWQYMICNAGMKNLKGQASRHMHLGRERCAYFFWQGKSSTINEKGASALMTVELDEERGPQILVEEGKEPACFLNLFKGRMIIHIGKREEESTNTQGNWRFYCLRNEYDNEMCLIEVPTEISSLRSVSSFVLLNVKTGALTVWHGCKAPEHTKVLALKAAENLKERCPLEVGLHKNVSISITEVEEGRERTDFWRTMNVHIKDRSLYCSLLDNPESFSHTLRLFHMTSVSGVFDVHEIINPSRSPNLPTKFPVLQTDLYKASQPALFLVDNGHEVYLWQGWWPEGDENQENVLTGSAQTRFTADRRCAMETTLHYCKEINPENPPSAFVVYAGLEPLQFTNLFPFWTVEERVREINIKDGKVEGELVPVDELLKRVTKTRFTLAELLEPTLPEGVDPLKLESYLSDEEFQEVFSMEKEEFYALPGWKQKKVKEGAGLF